jgi:hypothetical protein
MRAAGLTVSARARLDALSEVKVIMGDCNYYRDISTPTAVRTARFSAMSPYKRQPPPRSLLDDTHRSKASHQKELTVTEMIDEAILGRYGSQSVVQQNKAIQPRFNQ